MGRQSVSALRVPTTPGGLPAGLREKIEQRITGGTLDLPILPQVASQILAQGDAESSDVRQLSDLLHRDQALAGHVLRVANSAAYGGDTKIQSIQQALIRIGLVQMREIVITVALHGKVFRSGSHADLTAELWHHSTIAGLYAKEIARHLRSNVESAFVCGLLHDVGKPVVLSLVLDLCHETGDPAAREMCVAALDEFHMRVGGLLAERWELPEPVRDSITRHHETEAISELSKAVQMTALADLLAYAAAKNDEDFETDRGLLAGHPLYEALNLYPDDVEALFAKRASVLAQAEAFTA